MAVQVTVTPELVAAIASAIGAITAAVVSLINAFRLNSSAAASQTNHSVTQQQNQEILDRLPTAPPAVVPTSKT